jgi:hypothetical protein
VYTDTNAACYADAHRYGNSNRYADCNTNGVAHAHALRDSYSDCHTDAHCYAQGDTQTTADSASSPDSSAVSLPQRLIRGRQRRCDFV